ncbi:MAG: GMC oxidoreductase [Gammaproteobacteria bacterium HGW-Gammaproteobacteria-14]|nr:MAG: GMC oxidoreductase [Gammaproteobacteria bacterium HGW-Gammaproteobacteria-14]
MRLINMQREGVPVTQAKDVARDPTLGRNFSIQTDVVIVGSGAGGSTVAYELAKAGKRVLILESGRYWPSAEFTESLGDTLSTVYRDQAAQANTTTDVLFLEGHCVGGSTVIGACVMQRPPDEIFQRWSDEFGLKALAPRSLDRFFLKTQEHLNIGLNEAHEINTTAHKVIQGCEKMGYSWRPVTRNVKNCALTGHCLAGCPSDRKMSALVTHLPWATAHGARIFSDTEVTRVLMRGGRATGVEAIIRDPDTGTLVSNVRVDAQVVVVAAGAIHSPLLLQRSQVPDRSGQLGKNMAIQPFTQVLGTFKEELMGFQGALVGVEVDQFLRSDGFTFYSALAEPEQLMAVGEQEAGDEHINFMKSFKHMAGLNAFAIDKGQGSVTWEGDHLTGRKVIRWSPSREDFARTAQAASIAARIMFSAGAERVWLPSFEKLHADSVFELDEKMARVSYGINGIYSYRMNSFTPHGTCRMGLDSADSVVSSDGEVHGVSGLYVADASIFPTPVSSTPQWTVHVLAQYVSERILARDSSHFVS